MSTRHNRFRRNEERSIVYVLHWRWLQQHVSCILNEAVDICHRNRSPSLQEECAKFSCSCRPRMDFIFEYHPIYVQTHLETCYIWKSAWNYLPIFTIIFLCFKVNLIDTLRRVWRYQRGTQNPYIEGIQTILMSTRHNRFRRNEERSIVYVLHWR
jgi:hypothetical protein